MQCGATLVAPDTLVGTAHGCSPAALRRQSNGCDNNIVSTRYHHKSEIRCAESGVAINVSLRVLISRPTGLRIRKVSDKKVVAESAGQIIKA